MPPNDASGLGKMLENLAAQRGRPFKIAISGSHSTGKTALYDALAQLLSDRAKTYSVNEVARELIAKSGDPGFLHGKEDHPSKFLLMLAMQMQREAMHPDAAHCIICDRGLIDTLAYAYLLFPDYLISLEGREMQELVRSWSATYDLVVKTAIAAPMERDGVRVNDEIFRARVDQNLTSVLARFGIPTIVLDGMDSHENFSDVLVAMNKRISELLR
jgi:nicotinamide riboside kinase